MAIGVKLYKRLAIEALFINLSVKSGDVSDKDYAANDRTGVIFDFSGRTAGYERLVSANLNYQIFSNEHLEIAAGLIYQAIYQKRYLLNNLGASATSEPLYFIANLNSFYKSNWQTLGPFLTFTYKPITGLGIYAKTSFSRVNYTGSANWNTKRLSSSLSVIRTRLMAGLLVQS
ncbi:hypothetical protein OQZ33_05370 [Pedobacter sp. MC2016-05]|uniref:hypothetical protein n=1 Tax=Pedobacter sp. MC2016-05 TaxID=2994474 RepID=UPI0022476856|nr:hypothetical protein [Pedobacter sp. MC2016-05]MCX2473752.1 hypothetical protein [Pedobacter sp. MC2016-05]